MEPLVLEWHGGGVGVHDFDVAPPEREASAAARSGSTSTTVSLTSSALEEIRRRSGAGANLEHIVAEPSVGQRVREDEVSEDLPPPSLAHARVDRFMAVPYGHSRWAGRRPG